MVGVMCGKGGHVWQGGMCGRRGMHGGETCMVGVYVAGGCMGGVHGRGCAWQGVCMAGGVGTCVAGGPTWQEVCVAGEGDMHDRKNGYCSGRYASYWNTFLL